MSTHEPDNSVSEESGATPPYGQAPVPPATPPFGQPPVSFAPPPPPTMPVPPVAPAYGPYGQQGSYGQQGTHGQPAYGQHAFGVPFGQPGDTPPYGQYGAAPGASAGAAWMGYGQVAPPPNVPLDHATAPPAARTRRLRNSLLAAAVLVGTAGGGVALGRVTGERTSNVSATSPTGSTGVPSTSGGSGSSSSTLPSSSSPSSGTGSGTSTGVGAGGGNLNVASVAAKVDPAIVDIDTVLSYQQESAAGTGIVLTSTGEVLTNNHVVDGATSIRVTDIGNGQTYTAKVVGTDATDDIAVIQLSNASGLATANLGDSSALKSGEAVLAIGNAGGAGGTPSTAAGAIVALDQSITATDDSGADSEHLSGLVETNAPIQPGDSGGPLANSSSQVVAIDTAASSGNQFQAASTQAYAIPINTALTIAREIESGQGSATVHIGEAAMLGIEVEPSGAFSGSSIAGAVIAAVIPGSPAASAGLSAGDVIVSLNGETVGSPSDLSRLMSSHHPGDQVTVGYDNASGQPHSLTVTLGAGPPA